MLKFLTLSFLTLPLLLPAASHAGDRAESKKPQAIMARFCGVAMERFTYVENTNGSPVQEMIATNRILGASRIQPCIDDGKVFLISYFRDERIWIVVELAMPYRPEYR